MNLITILITDDHAMLRETWQFVFTNDPRFKVVGTTGTGEESVQLASQHKPDIILMDINLPGMNGIEATEEILKLSPLSKVLAISLHSEPVYARKMFQKGAKGYVTKNSTKKEIFLAIEEILKGNKYVCKDIKDVLAESDR